MSKTSEARRVAEQKLNDMQLHGRAKWRSLLKMIKAIKYDASQMHPMTSRYDGSHIIIHQTGFSPLTLVKPHGNNDVAVSEKVYKSFFLELLERSFQSTEHIESSPQPTHNSNFSDKLEKSC